MNTGLVIFTDNLRISDNAVLLQSLEKCNRVIGCYWWNATMRENTVWGFEKTGPYRLKFLYECIKDLHKSLKSLGIPFSIIQNESDFRNLLTENQISQVFIQKHWLKEEVDSSHRLKLVCDALHVNWHDCYDNFLITPEELPYHMADLPEVFTEFRKRVEKECIIPNTRYVSDSPLTPEDFPELMKEEDLGLVSVKVDERTVFPFSGGETQALKRVQEYFFDTEKLSVYKKTRNGLLGKDYSSKLSPWLAHGCISPRYIYEKVKEFEHERFKNASTYWLIFELLWREYFRYISLKYKDQIFSLGGIKNRTYSWNRDQERLNSWMEGRTGDDFVDANMIELNQTGWMSNRGRQNVASFLAKSWKVDWRAGAAWFENRLIDYDPHSNYGNWMYCAGVGNDPRDRIFNTKLQAKRYDGEGRFRRRWLQKTLF